MFASHRLVPLEERGKVKGKVTCLRHNEPYIMYSVEARTLACIECFNNASLDARLAAVLHIRLLQIIYFGYSFKGRKTCRF